MPLQAKPLPPAADLWERYSYNPLTGELFSRVQPKRKALGTSHRRAGHLETRLLWCEPQRCAQIHRIIWKWVTGEEPGYTIDHINRVPWDNRIWNLRVADWSTQMLNRDYSNPNLHINAFKPGNTSNAIGVNQFTTLGPDGKLHPRLSKA
jgi:hypothetical protein